MTYDEMIAVLQAAKEGKTIQTKLKRTTIEYADTKPTWNFDLFDYRVKPEPKIRPYANAEEFLAAMKEHGPYLKGAGDYCLPIHFHDEGVWDKDDFFEYEQLLEEAKWQDGHPCGIEK